MVAGSHVCLLCVWCVISVAEELTYNFSLLPWKFPLYG